MPDQEINNYKNKEEEYIFEITKKTEMNIGKNGKKLLTRNEIELNEKKYNKKNLNLQTEEELEKYINENIDNSKYNNIQTFKINEEEERNIYNIITENNNNLPFSKKTLPAQLKLYKCVVWKKTEPNLYDDIYQTVMHYRTRSKESNKAYNNKSTDNIEIEEKKDNIKFKDEEIL